jgi:hypothetical protein
MIKHSISFVLFHVLVLHLFYAIAATTSPESKQIGKDKLLTLIGPPGSAEEGLRASNQIDGVYKVTKRSWSSPGNEYNELYTAEDILEIVKAEHGSIYFKTSLNFDNNHSCLLFGIAKYKKDGSFVYQENASIDNFPACLFRIKKQKNEITFEDINDSCRQMSCGVRGYYDKAKFPLKKRRVIRYMERLKNSEEYKDALRQSQP